MLVQQGPGGVVPWVADQSCDHPGLVFLLLWVGVCKGVEEGCQALTQQEEIVGGW